MIVETKYGLVNGCEKAGFHIFRNIPFARPPLGELRFKPPQPPEPWLGILNVEKFGFCSIQDPNNKDNAGIGMSEDCLNLCVWTPTTDKEAKLPVVVHVHGGGYFAGSNSEVCFDGQHFAPNKDIVFVAIQYRLGALGFLYLGDLLGDEYISSGSCGTLDQIAALKWVNENVAAFGGNPEDITLMGESAGGRSVAAMITTPASKGLFKKAILQSGSIQSIRDKRTATAFTEIFLKELGLALENASELLTMSTDRIVQAQTKLIPAYSSHMFGSVIDGVNMFVQPEQYILKGNLKDVDILVGANRDEMKFPIPEAMFTEEYVAMSFVKFGDNADYVRTIYHNRLVGAGNRIAVHGEVMTDYIYLNAGPVLVYYLVKGGGKAWLYRWDHDKNTLPIAHHFSEMAYIFRFTSGEYEKGFPDTEENRTVSAMMNSIWTTFVKSGNPNVPGIPEWKPYFGRFEGGRMHLSAAPEVRVFDVERDCDHTMPLQVIRLK